jgi:hypothetical protein
MAYNYKFVTNTPQPRINSYNFAINGRCYDPTNMATYYNPATLYSGIKNLIAINIDTAMGYPWFH